jgi:DNA-binding IclR family transcriptional regulator
VLRALATSGAHPLPIAEIAQQAGLPGQDTQRALEALAQHDVVHSENTGWKFTVELMRRWTSEKSADG